MSSISERVMAEVVRRLATGNNIKVVLSCL